MAKKLLKTFAVLVLMLFVAAPLCAKPWGIVATQPDYYDNSSAESIHTIDLGQTPPVVYGPFLERQITFSSGPGVFDIALLPGNKKALISTFGDSRVHLIDLSDPTDPDLDGSIDLSFFAEDIDVTKDGKLALVTDGGFSARVAFVNLKPFTLTNVVNLGNKYANAVAISPKNVVILADYFSGLIHYGKINKARNGFESLQTIALCDEGQYDNASDCEGPLGRPVNVTISPNGRTALVAIANGGAVFVFEITKQGDLIPGNPFILTGLPGGPITNGMTEGGQQSIAFQNDKTAYVVSQRNALDAPEAVVRGGKIEFPDADGERPNQLCQINILGPGRAQYVTARFNLLNIPTCQLFGVDTLAILNRHALVGNACLSIPGPYDNPYYNYVAYIDLITGQLTPIALNNYGVAAGVAIKP